MLVGYILRQLPPKVRLVLVSVVLALIIVLIVAEVQDHRDLPAYIAPQAMPTLSEGREIVPGVLWSEVILPRGEQTSRLWVYLPSPLPSKKLPCVFIAPAGTRLFHGIHLGKGDQPEHVPYARAGFAVVAYELDGEPVSDSDWAARHAAREFWRADGGVKNAQDAIRYALAKLPVDPRRLYTAGHSSAGTMALHLAESEPRIAACVAYAPTTDLGARLGGTWIEKMDREYEGYRNFVTRSSPVRNTAALKCPTFLFHADDDNNTPFWDNRAFDTELYKTNPHLTFVRVHSGGHYTSMVEKGIPLGIRWLRALSAGQQPWQNERWLNEGPKRPLS